MLKKEMKLERITEREINCQKERTEVNFVKADLVKFDLPNLLD